MQYLSFLLKCPTIIRIQLNLLIVTKKNKCNLNYKFSSSYYNALSFNAVIALDKNFNNVWVEKAGCEKKLH